MRICPGIAYSDSPRLLSLLERASCVRSKPVSSFALVEAHGAVNVCAGVHSPQGRTLR